MPARADGSVVDWAASIRGAWDISEAGALRQMAVFLDAGAPVGLYKPFGARAHAHGQVQDSSAKGCVLAWLCSRPGTACAFVGTIVQLAVCRASLLACSGTRQHGGPRLRLCGMLVTDS